MRFQICDPLAIEPLRTFRFRCILHWLDVFQGSPHTRQGTCSTPDRSLDAACMRPSRLEPACRAKQVPSERPEYNPATLHNLYLGSTVPLPARERYTTSRLTGRLPLSSLLAFLTALSTNSTSLAACGAPPRPTTFCGLSKDELHGIPSLYFRPFHSSSAFMQYSSEASPSRGSNVLKSKGKHWVPIQLSP